MRYSVGQVIYLLLNSERKVVPAQIIEQIVRKTLEGESISYLVEFPDNKRSKAHLEKLDAQIFTSSDEIKNKMIKNAKEMIESIIGEAEATANQSFDVLSSEVPVEDEPPPAVENIDSHSPIKVDLGDGFTGNFNFTESS